MGSPIQTNEASAAAASTTVAVAQTSNPTAGGVNIVWVRGPSGATVTGVADTLGNTYTARGNVTEAGTGQVLYQFTAPITTGGSANTVTATYGASTSNRGIVVLETAGTYDASNTGTDTGNDPTTSVSATNTAQPATVYMLCNDVQGGTPSAGAGFTNGGTAWGTLGLNARVQYKTVTTVASQSGNFGNAGFDRTNTGLVIVTDPSAPVITAQPSDLTVNNGANATFTVTATGATSYQWKKNGSNVGTNSASYTLTAASYSDQDALITVDCVNGTGTTTSRTAVLSVAFQLTGTGPRAYPNLGHPFGAGSVESWIRGQASSSPDVTLSLTGVNATGQTGNLLESISYALSGNQATGQTGTVKSAVAYALTGAQASGQVGTVVSSVSYALTGNQATGSVGTVSYANDITLALTGVSATGSVGTLTPSVSYSLTGNQATGQVGTVVPAVSYALTGVQGTGQPGSVSAAAAGSASLTGVQATGALGTLAPSDTAAGTGVQGSGQPGTTGPATSVSATGVQAAGQLGAVAPARTVALTGVQATGQPGSVTAALVLALTGVQGTGQPGSVSAVSGVGATLSGVQATGAAGTPKAALSIPLTGNAAAGQLGTVSPSSAVVVALTGVQASGVVAAAAQQLAVFLAGVQAAAEAGTIGSIGGNPWIPVDDSQSAAWDPGTTAGGTGWTPVDDSQSAVWS